MRVEKRLHYILVFAIGVIVFYWATYDVPEIFQGGGIIVGIANRFSEAFIVSYVFYFLVEIIPLKRKKKNKKSSIDRNIQEVCYELSELLRYLHFGLYQYNAKSGDVIFGYLNIESEDFLKKFNEEQIFKEEKGFSIYVGSEIKRSNNLGPHISIKTMINSINKKFSFIERESDIYDEDIINLISEISNSEFMNLLNYSETDEEVVKIFQNYELICLNLHSSYCLWLMYYYKNIKEPNDKKYLKS